MTGTHPFVATNFNERQEESESCRGFSSAVQFIFLSRAVFFGMFDTIRTSQTSDGKEMPFITTLALAQVSRAENAMMRESREGSKTTCISDRGTVAFAYELQ